MKRNPVRKFIDGLSHLFFTQLCESCGHDLQGEEEILCLHCLFKLPRTGYHDVVENNSYQNFAGRVPIVRATSFVYFTKQGMMQHLLHRLKYRNRRDIGRFLGKIFAEELKKCNWLDTITYIVPVPLHNKKLRKRGYNQANMFAQGIADACDIPVLPHALERTKDTATQTHKTRAERIENVGDVFRVKQADKLNGKHILLVDDVLTTGATLESCALELLKTKGVKISIATIAIATD